MLPPRNTRTSPLHWKLRPLPSYFALLMPLNQQVKKRFTALARVIGPDYKGNVGPLKHEEFSA